MIEKKIVFITGAGASYPFGFPTGEQLVNQILKFQYGILNKGIVIDENEINDFKIKLRLSNTPSIDIFIANNPQYSDIAKLYIAYLIVKAENQSENKLFEKSWLKYIWHKMVEGCLNFNDFKNNKVKFVTFNYDRTLEYFFASSITNFFSGFDEATIYKDIYNTVPVYHVFGKVGNLEWENSNKYRSFKSEIGIYDNWKEISNEIKTIYESQKSNNLTQIINIIKEADEVHFLGFGFNSFNLGLLDFNNWHGKIYISGSRFNLSQTEISDLNILCNNKLQNLTKDSGYDCYNYLKNEVSFFIKSDKPLILW